MRQLEATLLLKQPCSIKTESCVTYLSFPLDETIRINSSYNNYMWEEAVTLTKNHQAQIKVHMPVENIQTTVPLFVKKVCSFIDNNIQGIYMNDVIYEPEFYLNMAKMIDQELFPIYNTIWIGLYPLEEGIGAYTDGLEALGYREIETRTKGDALKTIEFMRDAALYVITHDVQFKDGETIGLTVDQILSIHLSESEVFNNETFKIDDPF